MKEYRVGESSSIRDIAEMLNRAASNGRELVGHVQAITKIEWVGGIQHPVAYYVATMVREMA